MRELLWSVSVASSCFASQETGRRSQGTDALCPRRLAGLPGTHRRCPPEVKHHPGGPGIPPGNRITALRIYPSASPKYSCCLLADLFLNKITNALGCTIKNNMGLMGKSRDRSPQMTTAAARRYLHLRPPSSPTPV